MAEHLSFVLALIDDGSCTRMSVDALPGGACKLVMRITLLLIKQELLV
jgi:hypothetical protein